MDDYKTQLWGLLASAVVWLAGQAWSYVRGRLDASQQADLDAAERWAQKSAAWALVHFPGLPVADLEDRAVGQLRTILSNLHLDPGDATWEHLRQVAGEFITNQLLAKGIATSPGVAPVTLPVRK